MWIKFSILMLVALINVVLGSLVLLRNKNKDKFSRYFFLMCLSGSLWSISIAMSLITLDKVMFLYFLRGKFIFATFIFITSLLFFIEFPYKIKKISRILKYYIYLSTIGMLCIILFSNFFADANIGILGLYPIGNKLLHLVFALYFIVPLLYGYYILFLKHSHAQGINKSRLIFVIIGTLISFIFGIYFSWYLPYVDRHTFIWLGPVFIIFMNFSISYLLLKKRIKELK
jgi:N-terminal 7TM region of histidine kinase